MSTTTASKKEVQKLQRAIVDALEQIKAQDIQVFNTEEQTALFERVIVVSGTSNRQTKALAASVRDAVRLAGFVKPRIEGEDNGEWIIVDCGTIVVHIMQPAIRQYYRLEDLWGDKPVRLRLGAPKPATKKTPVRGSSAAAKKVPAKKTSSDKSVVPKPSSPSAVAKKTRTQTAAAEPAQRAAGTRAATTPTAARKASTKKESARPAGAAPAPKA